MITQCQKMRCVAWGPLPFYERKYATDVERIVTNLHLRPHHLTIVEFLRPVEFIMLYWLLGSSVLKQTNLCLLLSQSYQLSDHELTVLIHKTGTYLFRSYAGITHFFRS